MSQNSKENSSPNNFCKGIGLFDALMFVIGAMIGSGIFIVSSEMARLVGSPGWLLVCWLITGVIIIFAAISYGELSAMMPQTGGQYIYLKESYSPVVGFSYGWTMFSIIMTGAIAAIAVAFARYAGAIFPWIDESHYLIPPIHISETYAFSLSTAQLVGISIILLLTWTNSRGLKYGKILQAVFTIAKLVALFGLIFVAFAFGWNKAAIASNFTDMFSVRNAIDIKEGFSATTSTIGLICAILIAQSGSIFAADSWNKVAFNAGEIINPKRTLPMAMAFGVIIVIFLYIMTNLSYMVTLPFDAIQNAPSDRLATATMDAIFPGWGTVIMAIVIMISTFGGINGVILSGSRLYYALAQDGFLLKAMGRLNKAHVPGWGLLFQGLWAAFLILPRTYNVSSGTYGNLYTDLLRYVITATLIFYILTLAAIFRLRYTRPEANRPCKAIGYPVTTGIYLVAATTILIALFCLRPQTGLPGILIVLSGLPFYWWQKRRSKANKSVRP